MVKGIDETLLKIYRGNGLTQKDLSIILGVSQQRISLKLKALRRSEFKRNNGILIERFPELEE